MKEFLFWTSHAQYASDLAEVIRLFFDDVRVTLADSCEEASLSHFLLFENGCWINKVECNSVSSRNVFSAARLNSIELKRLQKRYAKLCVYDCLQRVKPTELAWGALTGIRPTKLACELSARTGDYKNDFRELFHVSENKIALVDAILGQQEGLREANDDEADVYVGIPFCLSRCSYCSFTCGEISRLTKYVAPYLDALEREISAVKALSAEKKLKIKNIYFGGGTPTSISAESLDRLLSLFGEYSPREFCVEAGRPDTIDEEKLEVMARRGVNRISVNPQSFNQRILDGVGRNHSVEDIYLKHSMAKKFGFDINMDLIAGLPGESLNEFKRSVDCAADLKPENITVHTLALKKGSLLKERGLSLADREKCVADMVDYARERLCSAGYFPYYLYRQKYMTNNLENVGYCLKGKQGRYNIDIMEETTSILACGSNAISKRVFSAQNRIERFANPKDIPTYIDKLDKLTAGKENLFL